MRAWKAKAEDAARNELGKPLPHPQDAINQAIAVLGAAPARFIPDAMANTSAAIAHVFSELDPSVGVTTEYYDGKAHYHVEALKPIELTFNAIGSAAQKLAAAIHSVRSDGADIEVSMQGVSVVGSPALEALFSRGEALILGTDPISGVARIVTGDVPNLTVELRGEARHGRDWLRFKGSAFDGLLSLELAAPLSDQTQGSRWSMAISCTPWLGKPLDRLPHIDRATRFVRQYAQSGGTSLELELNGQSMLQAASCGPLDRQEFQSVVAMLGYVLDTRDVAHSLGLQIEFKEFSVSQRHVDQVKFIADQIRTMKSDRKLTPEDEFTQLISVHQEWLAHQAAQEQRVIKLTVPEQSVNIFGVLVRVPAITTILTGMNLLTTPGQVEGTLELRLVPSSNAHMKSWAT